MRNRWSASPAAGGAVSGSPDARCCRVRTSAKLVDDRSTDGTAEVARALNLSGLHIIEMNAPPQGLSARQAAIHAGADEHVAAEIQGGLAGVLQHHVRLVRGGRRGFDLGDAQRCARRSC